MFAKLEPNTMRHKLSAALLAFVTLLVPTITIAQSPADLAARRELILQAQQARDSGDHARALDLATRAGQIQMTPSLRLFIAEEQNATGQLAPALGSADQCVREAERDPTIRDRATILQVCRELAASLRTRVGRVVVRVPSPAPEGLRVTVAGNELHEAFFGVPYVVTPGNVVVEASAQGRPTFRREVHVEAGSTVEVPLDLGAAEPSTSGQSPLPLPITSAPGGATAPSTPSTPATAHAQGPGFLPFVVIGTGAAALGTSLVFFVLSNSALGELDQFCSPPDATGIRHCDNTPEARGRLDTANTFGTVSLVTFVSGAALVGGGVLWALLGSRGTTHSEHGPRIGLAPTLAGFFVTLGGSL